MSIDAAQGPFHGAHSRTAFCSFPPTFLKGQLTLSPYF
jgi:hypothetical protein